MSAEQKVMCGNEDHARPVPAVARMSWPDGRFRPTTACAIDLRVHTRSSIEDGHPVLVEPVEGSKEPVIAAFQEVVKLHRRAYSEPVKAILLEAPDHPHYEELPETLEERRKLPARFHIPVWDGDGEPNAWLCAVCWEEGVVYSWPCKVATEHGGEVFAR
ncbi:hypothetical protein OG589_14755 [Sphaerisporangium sp. NBC_01403]|uniref:hypothetical protein n=1 Tax=Sphaerisporangium sp. NBC_01403 TaxID=2903599 RepID=UPI003243FAA3